MKRRGQGVFIGGSESIIAFGLLDGMLYGMTAISYTAARENLASTMDKVCNDHEPVIITRNRNQAVVMLSLEDYSALEETAYLTRTPANARRLAESIAQIGKGKIVRKKLKDFAGK
jgi:antitoxin YefM